MLIIISPVDSKFVRVAEFLKKLSFELPLNFLLSPYNASDSICRLDASISRHNIVYVFLSENYSREYFFLWKTVLGA